MKLNIYKGILDIDSNNNILCHKCLKHKSKLEFYNSGNKYSSHRNYCAYVCIICQKEKYNNIVKKNKGIENLDKILADRISAIRERCKKFGFINDFNVDYLKLLWMKQDGKCALSNINMTYILNNGRIFTNVSIDRIDSSKGYLKDNVQLVCMAVNQMKSDLTSDQLLYFCNEIIKTNENKN